MGWRPMPTQNQSLFKTLASGVCCGCGGDHWYRDCPDRKEKPPGIPPIRRFWIDFAIKHLIQDFSLNPEFKGKATLNYVEIIPSSSPSSSNSEHVVPMKVVTRAQAKAQEKLQGEEFKFKRSNQTERNQRHQRNWQRKNREIKKLEHNILEDSEFLEAALNNFKRRGIKRKYSL